MRIFIIIIFLTTAAMLMLSTAAESNEFIASCEIGTFLVCHYFPYPNQVPIELCVSEANLIPHLQFYPNDTQEPCPTQPMPPATECPFTCETFCSSACQNLLNTTANQNVDGSDCFDCQGNPGDPGHDGIDGLHCWDKDENHDCDLTLEDLNKDGKCTLEDCHIVNSTTTTTTTDCLCSSEPIKLCCYVSLFGTNPPISNPSPILGQIRWIAWKDCQRDLQGHAPCQGQLMAAIQNSALFSLMRTKYGGDGVVTFALPDFQNMKI